ncbi:MAG TPA: glycosyltransferase [Planctomycetes bacterium]|nr:glycosyltransferase [Planctomycetota bacterium]
MPEAEPMVPLSVCVLSWNTRELTLRCLDSLKAARLREGSEVLVLDQASEDGSAEAIAERHPWVRLIRSPENTGFAIGNNLCAAEAKGEYLVLLNSDTEVPAGGLEQLADFLATHRDYGASSPRLVNPDGSVQPSCKRFPGFGTALVYDLPWARWPLLRRLDDRYHYRDFDHQHDADIEQPPAACFCLRRSLWEELGGFDPDLWLFYNDVDLCLRIHRKGLKIRFLSEVVIRHHEGASTRNFAGRIRHWGRDRIRYYRKWKGPLGAWWVRRMLGLRARIEWLRLGRQFQDPAQRKAARRELKIAFEEILQEG